MQEVHFEITASSNANNTNELLGHHHNRLTRFGHNLLYIRLSRRLASPNSERIFGNRSEEEVFLIIERRWNDDIDV